MKHIYSLSSALVLLLFMPLLCYIPGEQIAATGERTSIFSGVLSHTSLIAQDRQERAPRPPRAPQERPPRYDEPLPEIEIEYDRPIDLHSPPGFEDPGGGDDPETPVPLPGVVWVMLAGGAYAVRKLRKQQPAAKK